MHLIADIKARFEEVNHWTREAKARRRFTVFLVFRCCRALERAQQNPENIDLVKGSDENFGTEDFKQMLERSIFPGHEKRFKKMN